MINLKKVSDDVKAFRFAICKSCDDLNPKLNTCKICHCFMPAKTMFAAASCPVKRWSAEPVEEDKDSKWIYVKNSKWRS